MCKRILLPILIFSTILPLFADVVDCNSQDIFKNNTCDICANGGEVQVGSSGITFPETIIPWENKSTTKNNNFYKTAQGNISIITDIGTVDEKWYETAFTWGKDVSWSNYGGADTFSVGPGTTLEFRKIEADSEVLAEGAQATNSPILIKVPIRYNEEVPNSFEESEEKVSNYCVAFAQKGSISSPSNPNTNSNTTNNTNSNNVPNNISAQVNSNSSTNINTNTNNSTTNTTNNNSSTNINTNNSNSNTNNSSSNSNSSNNTSASTTPKTSSTPKTSTSTNNIPTYNAKVSLNSAPPDPKVVAATQVETGPGENMLVLFAAVLLSFFLFPRVNRLFSHE